MTQAKQQFHSTLLPEHSDVSVVERQAVWHLEQSGRHDVGYAASSEHLAQANTLATALAQFPEHLPIALNLQGRIALEKGQFIEAEFFLSEASKLAPKHAGIAFSRGHLALLQHRLSEASTWFRRAIDIDPNATIADQSLAYVKFRSGLYAEAFADYRKLVRKYPQSQALKNRLLECCAQIKADYYDASLAADITELLNTDGLDYQALAPLAGSLLIHRYQLANPQAQIELHQLVQDDLLLAALRKVLFVHPELDELVATLRHTVLHHHLTLGHFDADVKPLLLSLAQYSIHNEFVTFQTTEEQDTLLALRDYTKSLVTEGQSSVNELSLPLLLLSLYGPLTQHFAALPMRALLQHTDQTLQSIFTAHWVDTAEEEMRAQSIPALNTVNTHISNKVRAQYEDNPYPRWTHLPDYSPTHYGRAVAAEIPAFMAQSFQPDNPIRLLVAGSGTGRHAINLARHFHDMKVTAIDLSTRSLAYGQMMAERYETKNIAFYHADILSLRRSQFPEKTLFDVIECSGVLHHMENPMAGWEVLSQLLRKNGLMKVALYSRRARTTITQLRQVIQREGLSTSPEDIRRFRQVLLDKKTSPELQTILTSPDFYSMSGVRDLLFHAQEHVFSPADLKQMIEHLPLEFLGFVLPPSVRRSYQHFFPDDALMNNLDNWERLEIDNPRLFGGMYQMYLQKK